MGKNSWLGIACWAIWIVTDVTLLLAGHPAVAFLATMGLAAAWCIKMDREEYEVQLLDSDTFAVNR